MQFVPIKLDRYVRMHLKSNPGEKEADVTARLRSTLNDYKRGTRCACGEPIWVIGSVWVGNMCFTCITGSTDASEDYEIDEACDQERQRGRSLGPAPPDSRRLGEKAVTPHKDREWDEAKRRCQLSDEEVRMAKELGFRPKSLLKNIPSPTQRWKMPVKDWVRSLYEKKSGPRGQAVPPPTPAVSSNVVEFRNPEYPWPDRPEIPEHIFYDPTQSEDDDDLDPFEDRFEPPSESDVEEENVLMLRRQCLFRWAAQSIAIAMSKLPEVRRVAAFGAVAQPLEMEVPRFREFRRHGVEVLHKCADLDLAVWTADLSRLKELKRAMALGLSLVHETPYGGVANHQVDVHLLDAASGDYRGRLCAFGQCPKPRKPQCLVPGCGAQPFLQQFNKFRFNRPQFEGEAKITLFDRASGYLVRAPRIEVNLVNEDDVPF